MSRRPASLALSIAALLVMGGCDAASTAPGKPEFPNGAPTPAVIMTYMAEDSSAADFVVTPSGGFFNLGPHGVYFPPNAICDPATTEYGVEHWDKRCRTLRDGILIHAEIRYIDGRHIVDFTPALRFAPSKKQRDWVYMYMRVGSGRSSAALTSEDLNILWFPHLGAEGIDESIGDPTQRTFLHEPTGFAVRRIKHFSGYQVHDGRTVTGTSTTIDAEVSF